VSQNQCSLTSILSLKPQLKENNTIYRNTLEIQGTWPQSRRAVPKPRVLSAKTSCRGGTVLMEVGASLPMVPRNLKLTWSITDPTRQRDAMRLLRRVIVVLERGATLSMNVVPPVARYSLV
jgi:hypothetical protein